ncbi:MAG: hypothetical protein ISR65_14580 [Bacteriovoracaceae bacterium]|nr:hypothetical protein [Bacteriovoracaceae bacterium]
MSVRQSLIVNDIREAINGVKRLGSSSFERIYFVDNNQKTIFKLPTGTEFIDKNTSNPFNFVLFATIHKPVYLSSKLKTTVGNIYFVYYRFEFIIYAILLWSMSIIASIIFIKKSKERLESEYRYGLKVKRDSILSEIAGQVAHDIRSPLAALDMVMKDIGKIPETKRLMIRSASTRIHDIANNLLQKNRELSNQTNITETKEELSTVLLPVIVESILTEKRMQFRHKIGININSNISESSYGLFTKLQPREAKRVISNILNNSIEILVDSGNITVDLFSKDDKEIELRIKDDGKGIPPEVLSKLAQKGETHGKKDGSGLGLYHARTSVNSWGGTLKIDSIVGIHTTIIIHLPKVEPPTSFVPQITLNANSTLVIVDDDESIHQVWNERLESINFKNYGIKVLHFSRPEDVALWVSKNDIPDTQFLVDYEYICDKSNGLDLIEQLDINGSSYLVTSRFEEKHVQKRCNNLNVGLIPKGMAGFIPMSITSDVLESYSDNAEKIVTVLLDNDALICTIWKSMADDKKIPLNVYSNPEELLQSLSTISKDSTFYIDSSLENGLKGEDIAKKLFDKGYKNLYLATGYEPEDFLHLSYIKGVIGKEPPWS